MSKIRRLSKNNSHTSNDPSKGVQKNILKAWNFTQIKLRHRCFANNVEKIFQTNILDNGAGEILVMVVLIVDICLDD